MQVLVIILFLLIALLLIKVSVIIKADNKDIAIYLSILFLRFKLFPKKEKEEKVEDKPKAESKQAEKEKKKKKKISFSEILKLIKTAVRLISKIVPALISAIRIDRCKIQAIVASDNAADTAINFGKLNAAVSSLYSLILNCRASKKIDISIDCDFLMPQSSYYADIKLSIRVWRAVLVAIKAALMLLPMLNKKENVYD